MEYKITAVSQETRNYDTKFGPMVSYKLKLEGVEEPVELGQKATSPAPQAGQMLNGNIENTQYGKKFKKEYAQQGFTQASRPQTGGGSTASQGTGGKDKQYDSFTMFLSYAKDIAVIPQMYDAKGNFNDDLYGKVLEAVALGGKTLYNDHNGTETETSGVSEADKQQAAQALGANQDDFVDL
jgi:hypothetical protein